MRAVLWIGEIGTDCSCAAAGGFDRGDGLDERARQSRAFSRLRGAGDESHRRAFRREPFRDRDPDAAARAGDESDASVERAGGHGYRRCLRTGLAGNRRVRGARLTCDTTKVP